MPQPTRQPVCHDRHVDTELVEIGEFLARHAPFEALPQTVLRSLPARLTARYHRRDSEVIVAGGTNDEMFVIRSGAADVRDVNGVLVARLEPGETFGWSAILAGGISPYTITTIEDCLVLVMGAQVFAELSRDQPIFGRFFERTEGTTLREAVSAIHVADRGGAVLKTHVADIIARPPVTIGPDETIRAAATRMRHERVSCLLVTRNGSLTGILTDRDLRNRVIAQGRDTGDPVSSVMTTDPWTAGPDALAFELLVEMTTRNIHHLPVVDGGTIMGLVSDTDLIRLERTNPIYLVGQISRLTSVAQIASVLARTGELVHQLVAEDATADDIGRIVTTVRDAAARRVIELVEHELAEPPIPYCWVVLGSDARLEAGLASDQDHAIITYDDPDDDHDDYFAPLAQRVTTALQECGLPPCPDQVMATNPVWRAPYARWVGAYRAWVAGAATTPDAPGDAAEPTVPALAFDLRALYGDRRLLDDLHEEVLALVMQDRAVVRALARDAARSVPPVGFFRDSVLHGEGEQTPRLDLKRHGIDIVVELARCLALAAGLPATNTRARLAGAAAASMLPAALADDLADALEFIGYARLRHQSAQARRGDSPDNLLDPSELSAFDKRHLSDAFRVVRSAQQAVLTLVDASGATAATGATRVGGAGGDGP